MDNESKRVFEDEASFLKHKYQQDYAVWEERQKVAHSSREPRGHVHVREGEFSLQAHQRGLDQQQHSCALAQTSDRRQYEDIEALRLARLVLQSNSSNNAED